jgi:hypothetical protein
MRCGKYPLPDQAFLLLCKTLKTTYFVLHLTPMQLMMYLGNDLIETVPVSFDQISKPGYLGKFKRLLKEKYAELIRQSTDTPEFLVVPLGMAEARQVFH